MEYVYAALLLHKTGQEVSEDNVTKVVAATGAEVDAAKVKVLIAALKDVNIDEKLANASLAAAPAGGAASGDAPASDSAAAPEEKKEEPKAEAAEGLASLFG